MPLPAELGHVFGQADIKRSFSWDKRAIAILG